MGHALYFNKAVFKKMDWLVSSVKCLKLVTNILQLYIAILMKDSNEGKFFQLSELQASLLAINLEGGERLKLRIYTDSSSVTNSLVDWSGPENKS